MQLVFQIDISHLTLKTLSIFCNLNGIKTNLFRKKNRNKNYPKYYLKPTINNKRYNSFKKKNNSKKELYKENVEPKVIINKKKGNTNVKNLFDKKINQKNKNYNNENSAFTFHNSNNKSKSQNNCSNIVDNNDNKTKPIYKNNNKDINKIFVSNNEEKERIQKNNIFQNVSTSKSVNNKENNISNLDMTVNDEIFPEEKFNIQLYEDEKPKETINNINNNIHDNIYINNLSINYLRKSSKNKKFHLKKAKKKYLIIYQYHLQYQH